MEQLLYSFLEAGIFGAVIILLIMLLRLVLRKAPRRMICLLWLLAAIRLLLPYSIESRLSLQPREIVTQATMVFSDAGVVNMPSDGAGQHDAPVNPQRPSVQQKAEDTVTTAQIVAGVWVIVSGAMGAYAIGSYFWLKHKVREAVKCGDGIMESEWVKGAFLLGYIKPKVYLPIDISDEDRGHILAHERAHIANGDNWWKLLGYVCVCIHWYNPIVWLGYGLFCRDVEVACDERAVRFMGLEERKAYSTALLNSSRYGTGVLAFPVTFGEVSLKQRIKSILHYRKPKVWITVIAVILVFVVAVCFLTIPKGQELGTEGDGTQQTVPDDTESPATESPVTEPPETDPPATEPPVTEPPETDPPVTEPPATEPPVTAPPATNPPATNPPATNPPATNPPATNPPATEPPVINKGDPYSAEGIVSDEIRGKDYAPAEDTPDHAHSYKATVYGPFCTFVGYTEYRCSCSHVYYNDFTNAVGHTWEYQWEREVTANYDGGTMYRCSVCWELKMENYVPAKYKTYDLDAVDLAVTQYAASYGFQTFESGANSTAKRFGFTENTSSVDLRGGQAYLLQEAKRYVDQAYAYCLENGYEVSAAGVWVEIVYNMSGLSHSIAVYCATAG